MISIEAMDDLIDQVRNAVQATDTLFFTISPEKHKYLYMISGLSKFYTCETRPIRKVHLRKIAKRRKMRMKRLKRQYGARYKI